MSAPNDPLARIERVRNLLALFLVCSFVGGLVALMFKGMPPVNEQIITYMVGQLSGMATMALGFYFVSQVGKDALDAQKVDNTTKALDAIKAASGPRTIEIDQPDDKPIPVKEE